MARLWRAIFAFRHRFLLSPGGQGLDPFRTEFIGGPDQARASAARPFHR